MNSAGMVQMCSVKKNKTTDTFRGAVVECTQVHLINVCFSPKMRLKLAKMAISSMMVSLGF